MSKSKQPQPPKSDAPKQKDSFWVFGMVMRRGYFSGVQYRVEGDKIVERIEMPEDMAPHVTQKLNRLMIVQAQTGLGEK